MPHDPRVNPDSGPRPEKKSRRLWLWLLLFLIWVLGGAGMIWHMWENRADLLRENEKPGLWQRDDSEEET